MFKHKMLILVVAIALLVASCGSPAQPTAAPPADQTEAPPAGPKVITILWTQEFDTLNPLYSSMWFSIVTQQFWLAWAWEFDQENEAFPKLVTEIPSEENGGLSPDGTIITMHLREDIRWSDGEQITAEDFIFTYEMAIDPKNTVSSSYPYDNITSVTAPDDRTVVITFEEPFAPWLATLWHGILPAHILRPVYEAEGTIDNAAWNLAPTVGAGPYVFDTWESGSFARFVVNENYWGEKPNIGEIFMRFVPDDASQTAALKAGDGDIGAFVAYSDVPGLEDAGLQIITEPSGYNEGWFFLVNEEVGHPALLDVRVRRAIAMAFDREAIARDLLLGLTEVPASFWDALPFYNDPPLENYPYDPEAANALLDEAGWTDTNGDGVRDKDGVELVITHGTNIREIRQDVQAVAQQQLAQVGIRLELFSFDDDIYFADYGDGGPAATGELDIMEWSDGPVWPDADVYYWLCSEIPSDENPIGTNWFFICDEELDALIKQQASQVDPDERQQTISRINQIFHDQVYWLGLWQDPDVWAVNTRLRNVKFSGVTPFYNVVEWDIQP
jgi:peptide/nickel transport system substrate-binding protein